MTFADLLNTSTLDASGTVLLRLKPARLPIFAIGDKIFDMPSQTIQTVKEVMMDIEECFVNEDKDDPDESRCHKVMLHYRVTGKPNPTGDGAFPNSWRCDFEVCAEDKTLPLDY